MKNLVAGTKFCPRDMSPEFKSVWIEGTCRGDKTTFERKVASCELFMRHVPATLRKINQSENEITTSPCDKTLRVNTSRNLSPQHAPSCEQRMKFFPATCPCNMSPRRWPDLYEQSSFSRTFTKRAKSIRQKGKMQPYRRRITKQKLASFKKDFPPASFTKQHAHVYKDDFHQFSHMKRVLSDDIELNPGPGFVSLLKNCERGFSSR